MSKPLPLDVQLRAACTVSWYEAAKVVGVHQSVRLNGVPDGEWFTRQFSFTPDELLAYIRQAGIARHILDLSDQRGWPSAYMLKKKLGYEVGWYDNGYSAQRHFVDIDEAAADYVLAWWRMSRLPS